MKSENKTLKKMPLPIIRDTREQDGFLFAGFNATVTDGTLTSGDYSVRGFENRIAIERKSLDDLIGSISTGRERFERELCRLAGLDVAMVVVEAPLIALRQHRYKSRMEPKAAEQSCWCFQQRHMIPFHFAGDKADAEAFTFDTLRHYTRDRWKELTALERDWKTVEESQV